MAQEEVFEYGYRHGRQIKTYLLDVTSEGFDNLVRVFHIVFSRYNYMHRASHVAEIPRKQLIFLNEPPRNIPEGNLHKFPEPLTCQQAIDHTWQWLQTAEYGRDEGDGGCLEGWRVWNGQFGIVAPCWEAFLAVRPMYLYLPK